MPISRARHTGFSAIEAILVLGVTGLVVSLLAGIVIVVNKVIRDERERGELLASSRNAIIRMTEDIQEASAVVASQTINGTLYTTSRTVLVLSLPSLDANKVPITGSNDYVAFSQDPSDPTIITRDAQIASGSSRIAGLSTIARLVESLRSTYNEPNAQDATRVEVYVETSRTQYGEKQSMAESVAATLRNK